MPKHTWIAEMCVKNISKLKFLTQWISKAVNLRSLPWAPRSDFYPIPPTSLRTWKNASPLANYPVPTYAVLTLSFFPRSEECSQEIVIECQSAPLELESITYGSWLNRNEVKRSYFHNRTDAGFEHMCQCGLNQSCLAKTKKCNCDDKAPIWEQVWIRY